MVIDSPSLKTAGHQDRVGWFPFTQALGGYSRKSMITRIEQPKGWNSNNLSDVPPVNGVYVLRDQNQNILFIGSVGSRHLRDRLIGHLQVNDVPGVRYFEWYQTDGPRSAREKARQWIARYRPPFVHRRRRVAEAAPILG